MRIRKVRTNYDNMRLDELHTIAGKVLECMKGSELFTDLPIAIDELEGLVVDFQSKWQINKDGGSKLESTRKDSSRISLLKAFSRLATYVNHKADGDLTILVSSGFTLEAESEPLKKPGTPVLVMLLDRTVQGELELRFRKEPQAALYEYQYAEGRDEQGQYDWSDIVFTSRTMGNIISPTSSGSVYYVRVRARNNKGVSDWSAVVSRIAQ